MGQISNTSFDVKLLEDTIATLSNNLTWSEAHRKEIAKCTASPPAKLTPRQRAVYSHLCAGWTFIAQCDHRSERDGDLDEDIFERRVQFLSGNCPMSPKTLRKVFKMETPSSQKCEKGMQTSYNDVKQRYENEVNRVACLLNNFVTADGTMDLDKLITSMNSTTAQNDKAASNKLKKLLEWDCLYAPPKSKGQKYSQITPKNFTKCMVDNGMYGCARQEARKVARKFPDTCVFKVNIPSQ